MALEFFGDDEEQIEKAQAVFAAFAKMETRLKEYERARTIYKVCICVAFYRTQLNMRVFALHSLLWPGCRDPSPPACMVPILDSRNSMEIVLM